VLGIASADIGVDQVVPIADTAVDITFTIRPVIEGSTISVSGLCDLYQTYVRNQNSLLYSPQRHVTAITNPTFAPSGGGSSSNPNQTIIIAVVCGVVGLIIIGLIVWQVKRNRPANETSKTFSSISRNANTAAPSAIGPPAIAMTSVGQRGPGGVWEKQFDASTTAYYYFNHNTGESVWEKPMDY